MKKLQKLMILGLSCGLVQIMLGSIDQSYRLKPEFTDEQIEAINDKNAFFEVREYPAFKIWQRSAGLETNWFVKSEKKTLSVEKFQPILSESRRSCRISPLLLTKLHHHDNNNILEQSNIEIPAKLICDLGKRKYKNKS